MKACFVAFLAETVYTIVSHCPERLGFRHEGRRYRTTWISRKPSRTGLESCQRAVPMILAQRGDVLPILDLQSNPRLESYYRLRTCVLEADP